MQRLKQALHFITLFAFLVQQIAPAVAMTENEEDEIPPLEEVKRPSVLSPPRIPPQNPNNNNAAIGIPSARLNSQFAHNYNNTVATATIPSSQPREDSSPMREQQRQEPLLESWRENYQPLTKEKAKAFSQSLFQQEAEFRDLLLKASEAELDTEPVKGYLNNLLQGRALSQDEERILKTAFRSPRVHIQGHNGAINPLEASNIFEYINKDLLRFQASFSQAFSILERVKVSYQRYADRLNAVSPQELQALTDPQAVSPLLDEGKWPYHISHARARSLLSVDLYGNSLRYQNQEKGHQEGGASAVSARGGVHFKSGFGARNNPQPQLEWAMYALGHVLGFNVTPPTTLLYIAKVPILSCAKDTPESQETLKLYQEAVVYSTGVSVIKEELRQRPTYQGIAEKLLPNEDAFFKNFFEANPFLFKDLSEKDKEKMKQRYRKVVRPLPAKVNLEEIFKEAPDLRKFLKNEVEEAVYGKYSSTRKDFFDRHYPELKAYEQLFAPRYPISSEEFFARYHDRKHHFSQRAYLSHFVQASQTVEGESLFRFFQKIKAGQRTWSDLNHAAYSQQFLYTLLTMQTDVKDDNLMVDHQGRLINIDNDRTLASMIVLNGQQHFIEAKNVLLLIDAWMIKEIDPSIKKAFLNLDADETLLKWLALCSYQNQRYERFKASITKHPVNISSSPASMDEKQPLSTNQPQKTVEGTASHIEKILLRPGISLVLKKRFNDFKGVLATKNTLTHQEFLDTLFPLAGAYYQLLRQRYPEPHQAQDILWTTAPSCEDLFKENSQMLSLLPHEAPQAGVYEEDRTNEPQEEAQRLLGELSLNDKSLETKFNLLNILEAWLPALSPWKNPRNLFNLAAEVLASNIDTLPAKLQRLFAHPSFDPLQMDEQGNTLMHLWAQSSLSKGTGEGFLSDILKIWTEKGGELDTLNQENLSPFDVALKHHHEGLVEALLKHDAGKSYFESHLETFYHTAKRDVAWKGSALQTLFHERKQKDPHFGWVLQRSRMLPPLEPGETIEILTYNQGRIQREERYLPSNIVNQLWNHRDDFKTKAVVHMNGHRMVGRVIAKEKERQEAPQFFQNKATTNCLYFKRSPAFPGMAIAISLLQEEFFKEGFLPFTFAKIRNEPFLISSGIGRLLWKEREKTWEEIDNLQYVLARTPERLKELDCVATAKLILMAQLTNPEDGKPSNYSLAKMSNGKTILLDIDPEQAFVPAIARPPEETGGLLVQMKSILFCLDQNGEDIPEEVVDLIQKWDIFPQAERYLKRLESVHKKMQVMFEGRIESLFAQKESYIGIPFQKGEVGEWIGKLVTLQRLILIGPEAFQQAFSLQKTKEGLDKKTSSPPHLDSVNHKGESPHTKDHEYFIKKNSQSNAGSLSKNKPPTLFEAFERLEPFGAMRYRNVLKELKIKEVHERFKIIDGPLYEKNTPLREKLFVRKKDFQTSTRSGHIFKSQEIPAPKDRKNNLEQNGTFDPLMALEELKALHLQYTEEEITKIMLQKGIQNGVIAKLLGRKKEDLNAQAALRIIRNLNLSLYSFHQQQMIFSSIEGLAPYELSLTFSPFLSLSHLQKLNLRELRNLDLRGCEAINETLLNYLHEHVSALQELNLSRVKTLKYFARSEGGGVLQPLVFEALVFSSLERLSLSGCENLKKIRLKSSSLKHLRANHCRQLKNVEVEAPSLTLLSVLSDAELMPEALDGTLASAICFPELHYEKAKASESEKRLVLAAHAIEPQLSLWFLYHFPQIVEKILDQTGELLTLNLSKSRINADTCKLLAGGLEKSKILTSLRHLDLRSNSIGDRGIQAIVSLLGALRHLDLYWNGLTDSGATIIAKTLTNLTSLRLNTNYIEERGAQAIAQSLTTLTHLELNNNRIGDRGMQAIAQTLTALTYLDVRYNRIGPQGKAVLNDFQKSYPRISLYYDE